MFNEHHGLARTWLWISLKSRSTGITLIFSEEITMGKNWFETVNGHFIGNVTHITFKKKILHKITQQQFR